MRCNRHEPDRPDDVSGRPTGTRRMGGLPFLRPDLPAVRLHRGRVAGVFADQDDRAGGAGGGAEAGVPAGHLAVRRRHLLLGRVHQPLAGHPADGRAQSDCAGLFLRRAAVLLLQAARAGRDLRGHPGGLLGAHDVRADSRHPVDEEQPGAAGRARRATRRPPRCSRRAAIPRRSRTARPGRRRRRCSMRRPTGSPASSTRG